MLKKLLLRTSTIKEAAIVLAVASLISRLFGVVRDNVIASRYVGDVSDAYLAAFAVPDFIFNLLILGALSSAFIPVFTDYLKKNGESNDEAWAVVNSLVNIAVIVLAVILGLGALLAPELVGLVAPGFTGEKREMVTSMMRIMFLSPLFFGISNLAGGVLNSFKNFLVYSFAPILYNLGIIVGALYLVPRFGYIGLAYGVVLGAFMHMLIQIPSVFSLGYKYRMRIDWRHPALKKMALLMIPRTIGIGIAQVNTIINMAIASTLAAGAVSVFRFADNLQSLPIGIFGVSFAVAVFPTLAEKYSLNKLDEFKLDVVQVMRQILFFIVPTMVLYWLLRAQIVRLVLGYGHFDWDYTRFTVSVLAFFTFGMLAQSLVHLVARSFYALQDTRTPLIVSICSLVLDVALAWWLSRELDVIGLALAVSISATVDVAVLLVILSKKLGGLPWGRLWDLVWRLAFASGVMGGVGYVMLRVANWVVPTTTVPGLLAQTMITLPVAVLSYLAISRLLRVPETDMLISPLRVFMRWRKKPI